MAVDLSSNKNLWVLISGTAVLKSQELVGSELEKNSEKIIHGTKYFKSSSSSSKLKKGKDDGSIDPNFLKELSMLMNLDINQTYNLLCTYLLYEYKGSHSDIHSILKNERHTHGLMVEIWNYYYSERIYSLLCLKQLLSHWQDSNHAYKSLYEGFLQSVNSSNQNTIIDSVLKQLEAVCSETVPNKASNGSLMTDILVMRWAKYKLNEMCELLQIILLYYKDMEPNSNQVFTLFNLFQKHVFGMRHPLKHLLDSPGHEVLKTIGHLEVLVLIEAMELEWLYRCQNAGLEDFYLFKDKELLVKMNSAVCLLGAKDFHGPILLSWMLVIFYGGDNLQFPVSPANVLKQLGAKSIKLEAFKYLLSCLQLPIFSGNSVISNIAHEIVYSLLSLLLSTFEEESLGDEQALCGLACNLVKYPNIAKDFWEKGMESGLGILFSNLVQNFPMTFPSLLEMLASLASTSEVNSEKVIKIFRDMPFFSEFLEENNMADIDNINNPMVWRLLRPKHLYSVGNFAIKAGTVGQLLPISSGKQVIQWSCSINGWQMCLCEIHLLLQQAASGADHVSPSTLSRVLDITQLCHSVIKKNPKSISLLSEITNLAYALAERFSSMSPSPNLLIANCLNVIALMAESDPEKVWTNVLKMGILPYTTSNLSNMKNLSNLEMNGGIIGNLIASQEYMYGTYSITKSFLKLISSVAEHLGKTKDQHFLACVMLIVREIFPTYHRWRYADLTDRNKIGELCLEIFHKLLVVPHPKDEVKESSTVQHLIMHALLFTDLGLSLLHIIETGEDAFQLALEEQSSWNEGSESDLIHIVRLALSVLNRLLLLKSKSQKNDEVPLDDRLQAETIISLQPTHFGKKHHIVLTVSHYIFHRYDPRLTTLAVHLLKRFAKEIPISLLACLGNDAEAIRDMFLVRLQSVTEDIRLKIAILEFLSVCIHQQPGLFEMFVNPSSLSGKKDSKDHFSCLQSVLDILEQKEEGVSSCRPELYLAAVRFIYSLWYGQKYLAISALKKNKNFWDFLCSPLMAIKDNENIDNVTAYVLKILSLEFLYYSNDKRKFEPELLHVVKELTEKKILTKWSKFILEIPEFSEMDISYADKSFEIDVSINSTFLLSAWRDFIIVIAKQKSIEVSEADKKAIMSNIFDLILNLVSNPTNLKVLFMLSQMYYILLDVWKMTCSGTDGKKSRDAFVNLIETLVQNIDSIPSYVQLAIMTIGIKKLKLSTSDKDDCVALRDWINPVCTVIKLSTVNINSLLNNFSSNLPVVSILLLQEILSRLDDVDVWFSIIHEEVIIASLLSTAVHCLQVAKGHEVVKAIFALFCKFAEHPTSAEALHSCGLIQQLCLPLLSTYGNSNCPDNTKTKWTEIYTFSIQVLTSMLKTLQHFFFEDAIQFVGVHVDRMHQSLQCIKDQPSKENLSEAIITCNFLAQLILCRTMWQVTHPQSLALFLDDVCCLSQAVIAYLMRPNYLLHRVKNKPLDQEAKKSYIRDFRRMSSCEDFNESSPVVNEIQITLMDLLAVCLKFMAEFSPSMHQLLSNQSVNISEWVPVLQIGFGTPTLDQNGPINFGTLISCINVCIRNLFSKAESGTSPSKNDKAIQNLNKPLLSFILENSLAFLMSQAILYLLNPNLSTRDKQLIKRELGTELTSFTVGLSRCIRRGSNAPPSPSSSSVTPSAHRTSPSPGKLKSLSPLKEYPFIRLVTLIVSQLFK